MVKHDKIYIYTSWTIVLSKKITIERYKLLLI